MDTNYNSMNLSLSRWQPFHCNREHKEDFSVMKFVEKTSVQKIHLTYIPEILYEG